MRRTRTAVVLVLPFVLAACGSTARRVPAEAPTTPTVPATSTTEVGPEKSFAAARFSRSTVVTNRWFPLTPGTQYVYEGQTAEGGKTIPHRVVFTVTDLTKVVEGVRNVVIWDRDFTAGKLEETELAFFAQADDGTIWHFGQYPEVYENGRFAEAPAWVYPLEDSRPGITIKAEPRPGAPSYSQGWGPAVGWNDRARVHQTGQRVCVRTGCYSDVLVTDEYSEAEPGAHQLKFYAPGVGNIRVGWSGTDKTRETLELVKIIELDPRQLAEVRREALALEQRAYRTSKNVYAHTAPLR
ncbi:MAG TPA: hypothetical protein VGO94_04550 [Mycobacteriales bacterium]|nr:hypothetical protein [Mycobacteriales bacterium]